MRFLDLHLLKYGCFDDVRLDFSDDRHSLHVIYGPNEAGKSTALRAVTALLYRFPGQSPDDFRFPYSQLRVGATIQRDDGHAESFVRKKANKEDLLTPDGRAVPESALADCLGRAAPELFARMFRLDHEAVRLGGEQLREGKGDLATILFAAGAGATDLQQIQMKLDQEADRLFKPRGQQTAVSLALADLQDAQWRLSESEMETDEYVALTARQADVELRRRQLRERLAALHSEVRRLERLGRCTPRARRWRELQEQIAAMGDVVRLPENARDRRVAAVLRLDNLKEERKHLKQQIDALEREIAAIVVPELLLERATEIEQLRDRLGAHNKAKDDLPKRRGEEMQLARQAEEIARRIDPALPLDGVEYLRLPSAQLLLIKELAGEYRPTTERRNKAKEDLAEKDASLKSAEDNLRSSPAACDVSGLRGVVEGIRQRGDSGVQRDRAATTLRSARGQVAALASALPMWDGDAAELETLEVPSTDTVSRFEAELHENAAALNQCRLQREGLRDDLAKAREAVRSLEMGGSVPTEADLLTVRQDRDQEWEGLKSAWRSVAADAKDAGERMPVMEGAFEQKVVTADELSDRLRREADRVATLVEHRSRIETLTIRDDEIAAEQARLEEESRSLVETWRAAWAKAEIDPLSPREMRAWISQQKEIVIGQRRVRDLEEAAAEIDLFVTEATQRLAVALAEAGAAYAGEVDLGGMLAIADDHIARSDARKVERAALERDISRLKEEIGRLDQVLQRTREEFSTWKERWFEAIGPLRLPEKTLPGQAVAVLEEAADLFRKIAEREALNLRIQGIEDDSRRFAADVRKTCVEVAPDLSDHPCEQAAQQLNARLDQARRNRDLRRQREGDLARTAKETSSLEIEKVRTTAEIHQLVDEAGCTELSELPAAEERSRRWQALFAEVAGLEQQIVLDSGGASIPEILTESEQIDLDGLPFQVAELRREIDQAEEERSPVEQEIGKINAQLATLDRSGDAEAAATEVQAVLARLGQAVDRFTRIKVACAVLRKAIEEYRTSHQEPLLLRAGELFQRMTLGSFGRLTVGYPDERPVILGVRRDGNEVSVAGMSEGTRDLLYLALRLASLEQQLESGGEKLPFIVDDILIKLDDHRALATLEALAELAGKTQILFFTHHARMVELARTLPEQFGVGFHDLSSHTAA